MGVAAVVLAACSQAASRSLYAEDAPDHQGGRDASTGSSQLTLWMLGVC